jgi:diacylglycerol kinase (ATP)
VLEGGSRLDQQLVEIDERVKGHGDDASNPTHNLLVVNARASGVDDPARTAAELLAILEELDAPADGVLTASEPELGDALRHGAATGRRVVLVGGDGSLHAAANAPLDDLPELGLVPQGRANNVARSLRIPTDRVGALAVATRAPARPLDALRVTTPAGTLYAVEAVSAGFQAEARSGYDAENSADLRQGARALVDAVRDFAPYRIRARLDRGDLASPSGAQLFLSNLPYFGFGFEVDPGADPADGRLEAILAEAPGRAALVRLLAATYRGHHLDRPGVRRVSTRHAELTEALPLVADAVPLGTTTATVSVEPARLRVAAPPGPGGPA